MKIEFVRLVKHKHLALKQIADITFYPHSKFQWILGTNGSGKSSLLRECSPLPGNPAHYQRGGMKVFQCVLDGIRYRLTSDFTGTKNLFSFVKIVGDIEEELNPGHTTTVFNNLVLQVFRYDKEIHEFCIGRRTFTEMSVAERKSWVSRISSADYTYAIAYYQRLFTHYRDQLGSIKTDQGRLVEAKARCLSKEQEQLHHERLAALKEQIHTLTEMRPNPSMPLSQVNETTERLKSLVKASLATLRKELRKDRDLFPLGHREEVSQALTELKTKMAVLNSESQRLLSKAGDLQQKLGQSGAVISFDEAQLRQNSFELQEQINKIENNLQFNWGKDPVEPLMFASDAWLTELTNVSEAMTEDALLEITAETRRQTSQLIETLTNQSRGIELKLAQIQNVIQQQEECAKQPHHTCPKCQHQWHPGFQEKILRDGYRQKEELLLAKAELDKQLIQAIEQSQKQQSHVNGLGFYHELKSKYPGFQSFYVEVEKDSSHRKHPLGLPQKAFAFVTEIRTVKTLQELYQKLQQYDDAIKTLTAEKVTQWKNWQRELELNQRELERVYGHMDNLYPVQEFLERKEAACRFYQECVDKGQQHKKELLNLQNVYVDHQARSYIGDMILQRNHELLTLEKTLREIELQQVHVAMLEKQITEAQEYAKTLKLALDELSPKEGLIAYGLTGFINHFIKVVNSLIEKFWTYPMELVPILPDEDGIDLDYKFAIRVGEEIVEDIGLCSFGQKDVINIAFMIASMVFLHMDHGPLFLDEFGSHLDPGHRAKAQQAIVELLTHSNFSNVLMIFHTDESFNMNLEADITLLCDANIRLPDNLVYNRHTVIA